MALAIDASSPVVVNASANSQASASFTPPANSLIVVLWIGNTAITSNPAGAPTITDSLGVHLTYTQQQWQRRTNVGLADGEVSIWTAPVATSTAMTITCVNNSGVAAPDHSFRILVLTDTGQPTVGTSAKNASNGATSLAMSYTATATGSWGFAAVCDWDAVGAGETAGTGTTLLTASASATSQVDYGMFRRTSADGVNGSTTTLNMNLPASSTNVSWAAVEILPSGGGGVTPTATRAQPGQTWRRHFQHRQIQLPDPPPAAAPAAPNFVPTAMVRRRWNRRMLPLLPSGSIVSPVGAQTPPPRPRTARVTRRRFPYAAYGPDSFSPPAGQVRVPPQNRRRLLRPRLPVDGDSYSPPPNQQAPVVNPPITQMVTRALRRWGMRRDGSSVTPVPVQVAAPANPAITQTVTRALRRWGVRRVGHPVNLVPGQLAAPTNPSITQVTSGRVRRIGVLLRRPGVAVPTAQQGVVPAVQLRRAGFRFRRRPQAVAPVPVQVAAPANPPITQFGSLWAKRWGLRRYGRVANPTPGQQAAPTNPAITALTAVRARVGARALRRGKVSNPTPAQQAVATAPPLTQLTAVRGRAVVHGAPRRPQAAAPPIPQATPPAVTVERRGLLRLRRPGRVQVQPPPQAAAPPQVVHRPPRLRRMLRRLGFPIQGGVAPTSTAVSTIGSLGATATDLGSVSGPDGTGGGAGSTGLGGVAGASETGQTGGSGMTGSAQ